MSETTRERVVRLIREMKNRTTDRGCTPAEAAGFAAKVAEWVERYQIEEAELRGGEPTPETVEVCQAFYWTGKLVHNPGVSRLISGLARGVSCRVILLSWRQCTREAGFGIVGETLDAQFVVQMIPVLLPQLLTMARLEGVEHGHAKAGLVRWCNQYLYGAGVAIENRLIESRRDRSTAQSVERFDRRTALVTTGDRLAEIKKQAADAEFGRLYPRAVNVKSRAQYDGTARERGEVAGASIGLGAPVRGSQPLIGGAS